ncbi:GNAT family N-acetyltransferase [Plantactinospora sp. WMMB782]|uniref:GNAT family N-acetyltransferase n=1 Tax=Plantactinospora sp. WMMB782 TaxID=3404121 RepID=UPI003B964178
MPAGRAGAGRRGCTIWYIARPPAAPGGRQGQPHSLSPRCRPLTPHGLSDRAHARPPTERSLTRCPISELTLPIRTERLCLRQHRIDDVDALVSYYGDPVVARYIPWQPWSAEFAATMIDRRIPGTGITARDSRLALVAEYEGEVIGDVVLWPADETLSRGEMGWAFHPTVWGRGFATEAVRALIDTAFGPCGMHRVIAQVDGRNKASTRLCERVGMVREGFLRRDHWTKGEWTDTVVYGLLAEEWRG